MMGRYSNKIGQIPNDWDFVNAKECIHIESGMRPKEYVTDIVTDIPSLGGENIDETGKLVFDNIRYISTNYYKKMKKGKIHDNDIYINKDGANTGKVAFSKAKPFPECAVNEHVFLIRNNGAFVQSYLFYCLLANFGQQQILKKIIGSAQEGINNSFLKGIILPKPPLPEQSAIAAILSKVDEAIASVQASISAAERLKKSLMQNLLTGRMKPDGTQRKEDEFYVDEKFGRVPKGWEVKKGIEITSKITKGQSPKWQGFEYQNEGILFVTSENIRDGYIDVSEPKYLPLEFNNKIKNSQLAKGDVLINIVGASIGRCAIFDLDIECANTNQAVCVFRPNDENDSAFLSYYLQDETTQKRLFRTQVETARANLSLGDFRKFKFVIPKKEEQVRIATKINQFNKTILDRVNKIAVLERLKKSLMQNLLTGRVRVNQQAKNIGAFQNE